MIKKREYVLYGLLYLAAGLSVAILVGLIAYIFVKGLPNVNLTFLTTVTSAIKQTTGILGNIVNTLYLIVITMLIATPIGVGAAVYLNEYAKPGKAVDLIEFATETLAGIPSIIFGLFGMMFYVNICHFDYSIISGALTLVLMVLPLVTRNTQEALRTVPDSYRSGAVGLGAGKWYTIRTILLPSAMPGIITGVILAIGRVVGESAALLLTAGSSGLLPKAAAGYWKKIGQSGGSLTVQMYLSMSKGEYATAFGIAAVLLVIVLCINLLTKVLAKRFDVNRR